MHHYFCVVTSHPYRTDVTHPIHAYLSIEDRPYERGRRALT
jgi:hypothetical protein